MGGERERSEVVCNTFRSLGTQNDSVYVFFSSFDFVDLLSKYTFVASAFDYYASAEELTERHEFSAH